MIDIAVTIKPASPKIKKPDELDITLSEAASMQIQKLTEERNDNHILRVSIKGGGCSGFQTTFEFVEFIADLNNHDDYILKDDINGIGVIIDSLSATLIDGATIDYESTIMNSQFILTNPNAIACGCGTSFQLKDR